MPKAIQLDALYPTIYVHQLQHPHIINYIMFVQSQAKLHSFATLLTLYFQKHENSVFFNPGQPLIHYVANFLLQNKL